MRIPRPLLLPLYIVCSVSFCLVGRYVLLPDYLAPTSTFRKLEDSGAYARLVARYGGHPEQVKKEGLAPPIYSSNLPQDLSRLPAAKRKTLFIALLLPDIARVNADIRGQRQKLERLLAKRADYQRLTAKERWWLNRLAASYGCSADNERELRRRVDTVPAALVLAQAIDESGWGTSRFAREGNALFGQHLPVDSDGDYILSQRGGVKVAAFTSIYQATRNYIHRLNSVWAYEEFRRLRWSLRRGGSQLSGRVLAGGLDHYSELGSRYVRDLRHLINKYHLEFFNSVRLRRLGHQLMVQFSR